MMAKYGHGMPCYKVGDQVRDWSGRIGVVQSVRLQYPALDRDTDSPFPYERVKVSYPGSERWSEGPATIYRPLE